MKIYSEEHNLPIFILGFVLVGLIFAVTMKALPSFADDGENTETAVFTGQHFVTIYDHGTGETLTLKTDAGTVTDVLSRADIHIDEADIVEPSLNEILISENFRINIYRAKPAIVIDGIKQYKIMTAASTPEGIVKSAGITLLPADVVKITTLDNFLEAGLPFAYEVVRAKSIDEILTELRRQGRNITTIDEEIAFTEQITYDYGLNMGYYAITTPGEPGVKTTIYENQKPIYEIITKTPVTQQITIGARAITMKPLTKAMGRNRYTTSTGILREETYYDLNMSGVMQIKVRECGGSAYYGIREDGVKIDEDGFVIVAADLSRYPRCSIVETSLGLGKVYDTGSFVHNNPEQFDIATDWTKRDGI